MSFGAEWMFFDTFAVRGGYQNLFLQDSEVGLTLGAGFAIHWTTSRSRSITPGPNHGRLDYTQLLTFGVSF